MRSKEQQQAIIDAARRLILARRGNFTTQELTKEAGVALQTFYRHFGSKDHLLLALHETLIADQTAKLERRANGIDDPLERLRVYITAALKLVEKESSALGTRFTIIDYWRLFQLFPEEMKQATQPLVDLMAQAMRDAAAAGSIAPRDHTRDAWFTAKMVASTIHHYVFDPPEGSIDDLAESLWSYCLHGFGSDAPAG